jgi:hypothetical protein
MYDKGQGVPQDYKTKNKKGTEALLPLYPQHKMFEMEK